MNMRREWRAACGNQSVVTLSPQLLRSPKEKVVTVLRQLSWSHSVAQRASRTARVMISANSRAVGNDSLMIRQLATVRTCNNSGSRCFSDYLNSLRVVERKVTTLLTQSPGLKEGRRVEALGQGGGAQQRLYAPDNITTGKKPY